MKLSRVILALTVLGTTGFAEEVSESFGNRKIEMRPNEKRALTLKSSERNPYAKRSVAKKPDQEGEQNAEEIAIRSKIKGLTVSGSSRGNNGLRLLLGDILVERGMVLPQLVVNQTQHLKVVDVAADKIVLGWMDVESGELTGKTMQVAYDLAPSVTYVLQGQVGGSTDGVVKRQEMGVLRPRQQKRPVPATLGQ